MHSASPTTCGWSFVADNPCTRMTVARASPSHDHDRVASSTPSVVNSRVPSTGISDISLPWIDQRGVKPARGWTSPADLPKPGVSIRYPRVIWPPWNRASKSRTPSPPPQWHRYRQTCCEQSKTPDPETAPESPCRSRTWSSVGDRFSERGGDERGISLHKSLRRLNLSSGHTVVLPNVGASDLTATVTIFGGRGTRVDLSGTSGRNRKRRDQRASVQAETSLLRRVNELSRCSGGNGGQWSCRCKTSSGTADQSYERLTSAFDGPSGARS